MTPNDPDRDRTAPLTSKRCSCSCCCWCFLKRKHNVGEAAFTSVCAFVCMCAHFCIRVCTLCLLHLLPLGNLSNVRMSQAATHFRFPLLQQLTSARHAIRFVTFNKSYSQRRGQKGHNSSVSKSQSRSDEPSWLELQDRLTVFCHTNAHSTQQSYCTSLFPYSTELPINLPPLMKSLCLKQQNVQRV